MAYRNLAIMLARTQSVLLMCLAITSGCTSAIEPLYLDCKGEKKTVLKDGIIDDGAIHYTYALKERMATFMEDNPSWKKGSEENSFVVKKENRTVLIENKEEDFPYTDERFKNIDRDGTFRNSYASSLRISDLRITYVQVSETHLDRKTLMIDIDRLRGKWERTTQEFDLDGHETSSEIIVGSCEKADIKLK